MLDFEDVKPGQNYILYGPPGTGKTYNTIGLAYKIVHGETASSHKDAKQWYDEQVKDTENGRVAFTTFHQSYGYEEFIEGIRPCLASDEDDVNQTQEGAIRYKREDGIFKAFCERAKGESGADKAEDDEQLTNVWFANASKAQLDQGTARQWSERNEFSFDSRYTTPQIGDLVFLFANNKDLLAIGKIVTDFKPYSANNTKFIKAGATWFNANDALLDNFEVDSKYAISESENRNAEKFCLCSKSISLTAFISYLDNQIKQNSDKAEALKAICDALKAEINASNATATHNQDQYVFIIDEINRGNISNIFGELITLIESSKRLGAEEELQTVLPYSKALFGVPKNVTIIGTMNTADRSIAFMDTALRRRFEFIEMPPQYDKLEGIEIAGVNIKEMLEKINIRIDVLLDKEHEIGHAYFTELTSDSTIDDLAHLFKTKILPLLSEYFYEDLGQVNAVLGAYNTTKDADLDFYREAASNTNNLGLGDYLPDDAPRSYVINTNALTNPKAYKHIYA